MNWTRVIAMLRDKAYKRRKILSHDTVATAMLEVAIVLEDELVKSKEEKDRQAREGFGL